MNCWACVLTKRNLIFLSAAAPEVKVMLGAVSNEKEGFTVAWAVGALVGALVGTLVTALALVPALAFNT